MAITEHRSLASVIGYFKPELQKIILPLAC